MLNEIEKIKLNINMLELKGKILKASQYILPIGLTGLALVTSIMTLKEVP